MQFIVIATDYPDSLDKRMAVRDEHVKMGDQLKQDGKALYGAALLDDKGDMRGSMYVVDFEDRDELNKWLDVEPYVTGGVWEDIQVIPCQVGPSFADT